MQLPAIMIVTLGPSMRGCVKGASVCVCVCEVWQVPKALKEFVAKAMAWGEG